MANVTDNVDKLLDQLKQERDELKLKLHLAKEDLGDEWEKLEEKWSRFEAKAKSVGEATADASKDIGAAASLLGEEIKNGFNHIRKRL